MKKLVLFFAVVTAVAFASCKNEAKEEAPATDSTAIVADSATVVADSATVVADSATAVK